MSDSSGSEGGGTPPDIDGLQDWRFIGAGPVSRVWAARETDFRREVAVKVFGRDDESRELATRRAAAMGRGSTSPGSLTVLKVVDLRDGRIAVITPLLGGSLFDRDGTELRCDEAQWRRRFGQCCTALGANHRLGEIHGNIHAGNVMVALSGEVVLADADGPAGLTGAEPDDGRMDDLSALVEVFMQCAPDSDRFERLRTLVGAGGCRMGQLGIDSASALSTYVENELRRPVSIGRSGPVPSGASGGAPKSPGRRWKVAAVLCASLALIGGVTIAAFVDDDSTHVEGGHDGSESEGDSADSESTGTDGSGDNEGAGDERSPVSGIARDVSVSDGQACSLLASGQAVCWGMNLVLPTNQQGSETYDPGFDERPFALEGGPFGSVEITSDGTGNEVLCAVSNGLVSCRGGNIVDVPGDVAEDEFNRSDLLYPVAGVDDAVEVAVGAEHACALLEDRSVYCWGSNARGQVGNGRQVDSNDSGAVVDLGHVRALAAGSMTTCALKNDRTTWCWGDTQPPLGSSSRPQQVAGLPEMVQVSPGRSVICGIDALGGLWCWGDFEAAFGVRNPDFFTPPTRMEVDEQVRQVSVGDQQLCAVGASGSVWCWETGSMRPRRVSGMANAAQVDTYRSLSCALLDGGSVSCWGYATQDLAELDAEDPPVPIPGLGAD